VFFVLQKSVIQAKQLYHSVNRLHTLQ